MKLLRKWRAKGHGVHSPFAFHLIRNVIHSPHEYYAFSDIEKRISDSEKRERSTVTFNRLSFRLAHHFSVCNVLEINPENDINTMFIEAANKNANCTCVKSNEIPENQTFDAIFIYLHGDEMPAIETLLSVSHADTFWVIRSIKSKSGRRFWRNVVDDERARITFDLADTGIVFLQPSHHKLNYCV